MSEDDTESIELTSEQWKEIFYEWEVLTSEQIVRYRKKYPIKGTTLFEVN